MDFFEIHDAPIAITIGGVEYKVPLFPNTELINASAKVRRDRADFATAHLLDEPDGKEQKARYLTFWQPAPIDVREMVQWEVSPEGVDYVLRFCLKEGGMPEALLNRLLKHGNALQLRELADKLTLNARTTEVLTVKGESDSPLSPPPPGSTGSPATGGATEAGSTPQASASAA